MFAATVLRARENRPATWHAIGAWAIGSASWLWSREALDFNFFWVSAAYAGVSFLGLKFGKWLATKKK